MEKLIVKNEQEIRVVYVNNIMAIIVHDYICTFIFEQGNNFICTNSLSELEKILSNTFIRISRNTLVNSNKIIGYNKKQKTLCLSNNIEYRVSTRKLDTILARLQIQK